MLIGSDDFGLGGWLPDETLFSLASRYHRMTGNRLASTTCNLLFGHQQRGSAHDFPSRIDAFVERTEGTFGTAAEIIHGHTILPLFQRFVTKQRGDAAERALRGEQIGSLKYRLGLLTSRFGASFPLKACIDCIREDVRRFRVAYWHRAHQLPGVWLCQRHDTSLWVSQFKATGIQRFSWQLPAPEHLRLPWPSDLMAEDVRFRLRLLGRVSRDLCEKPPGWRVELDLAEGRYRSRLVQLGLALPSGRLHLQELGAAYFGFSSPLALIPEFDSLPRTELEARSQVARLLYRTSAVSHPLRHVLAIVWLFESLESFHSAPSNPGLPGCATKPAAPATPDYRRDAVVALVTAQGKSPSAAAESVGADPATAMAWLARAGVASRRRPKELMPPKFKLLVRLLRRGASKSEAASEVGVSLSTVTRVLRTEVGLHDAWSGAKHQCALDRHRREWSQLVQANPTLSIPLLRTILPSSYAWLYRNDQRWLLEVNASRPTIVPARPRGIDWRARDASLAQQVKVAAVRAFEGKFGARVGLPQLVALVPALKPKLRQLARLPQTARALEALLLSK